jgi:hypothetical protein
MERILVFSKWSAQKTIESNAEKVAGAFIERRSHEDDTGPGTTQESMRAWWNTKDRYL